MSMNQPLWGRWYGFLSDSLAHRVRPHGFGSEAVRWWLLEAQDAQGGPRPRHRLPLAPLGAFEPPAAVGRPHEPPARRGPCEAKPPVAPTTAVKKSPKRLLGDDGHVRCCRMASRLKNWHDQKLRSCEVYLVLFSTRVGYVVIRSL